MKYQLEFEHHVPEPEGDLLREAELTNKGANWPDGAAQNALDGNEETRWANQNENTDTWIEIDLKKEKTFNRLTMDEYVNMDDPQDCRDGRITNYTVRFWNGTGWEVCFDSAKDPGYLRKKVSTDGWIKDDDRNLYRNADGDILKNIHVADFATVTAQKLRIDFNVKKEISLFEIGLELVKEKQEEVLLDFSFDDRQTGFRGGKAVASPAGTVVTEDGRKALYLNGTASDWLNVTKEDGSSLLAGAEELVVSFDMKVEEGNWPFFAAPDASGQQWQQEHYIGVMTGDRLIVERYNGGDRPEVPKTVFPKNKWVSVKILLTPERTEVYIGEEWKAEKTSEFSLTSILGNHPILQIGKANWGSGEFFKGYLDNYKIVARNLPEEDPETEVKRPFVDVTKEDGSWYYDAVYYNYDRKIIEGVDTTHFEPLANVVRAQFAIMLHRMEGEPEVPYRSDFIDVEDELWYTDAIMWAASENIVTGYTDGSRKFGPADPILREQMAVMMYRYAERKGYPTTETESFDHFEDADKVTAYAEKALQWAVGSGIITGKYNGTQIDPQGSALRAECAIIFQRFLEFYKEK